MGRLDREARNAMAVLPEWGHTKSDVARLLGVSGAPFAITTAGCGRGRSTTEGPASFLAWLLETLPAQCGR